MSRPLFPISSSPVRHIRRRPTKPVETDLGGSPQQAAELLADIRPADTYGVLECGRIVLLDGADRVRACPDEALVRTLIDSGCVELAPARDATARLDGRVRRTVTPLRLTRGNAFCQRWNALASIRRTAGRREVG